MPNIVFPNVPNVPGVPALPRSITVPTPGQILNAGLSALAEALFGASIWGVYDKSGQDVFVPDSFLSVDFKNTSRVSDYIQEKGAFASYNKVNTPYDCRVRMAISSDMAARTKFLDTCDRLLKSIDLLSVITPEKTYLNATLQNYDYRREDRQGVSMLKVELWFLEVRSSDGSAAGIKPKQPSGALTESMGQLQAVSTSVSKALGALTPGVTIQ
jgi:hypothetical protein